MIESDEILVEKIKKQQDNQALVELISRHSGIYVDMVRRYSKNSLNNTQIQDLLEDKDITIYQAALKFDSQKSKFQTYLGNLASYACLSIREKNKKNYLRSNVEDVEFCLESLDDSPSEKMQKDEVLSRIKRFVEKHPNPKVKIVFNQRYEEGYNHKLTPWHKIGEKLGLTAQACIDIHNKTLKEFRKEINHEKH